MIENKLCPYNGDIFEEHELILNRHIDDHKYFQHIVDDDEARINFINHFGFLIREVYCDRCSENSNCDSYQTYLKNEGWKAYEK